MAEAKRCKQNGNDKLKEGNYNGAVADYKEGIDFVENEHAPEIKQLLNILRLNLSQAYLKLGKYSEVIDNCGKVLKEEDDCLKAFYRRGLAYSKAQEFDKAKVICHLFRKISKVCSNMMLTMLRQRKSWRTSKWLSNSRTKKRRNFLGIFFPRGNSMMM